MVNNNFRGKTRDKIPNGDNKRLRLNAKVRGPLEDICMGIPSTDQTKRVGYGEEANRFLDGRGGGLLLGRIINGITLRDMGKLGRGRAPR